jgi:hypothetical protein
MLSSGTGRITPPKIVVKCECGKRYRVPATKAGKKVRCKACKRKLEIPGIPPPRDNAISFRSRKAILAEFGINASGAERKYEEKKKLEGYVCAHCADDIPEDDLKAAYCEEGLVCEECRVAAVTQREFGCPEDNARKARLKDDKVRWATEKNTKAAEIKGAALGALFFFGVAGVVHTFFAPSFLITLPIAATAAFLGAKLVYRSHLTASAAD